MPSDEILLSSDFFLRRLTFASRSGLRRGIQAQNGIFRPLKTHFSSDLRGLNCRRHQIPHPYEVICSSCERKYPPDCFQSAMPVFRNVPTVFIQPKTSSMRFRFRWLT